MMFVLDDMLIGAAIGGGLNGLMGKDPIKGAALGGLGGAFLPPGLLGGSAEQGLSAGGMGLSQQGAGMGLKQGAQLGVQAPAGALTPTGGLLADVGSTLKTAKPIMDAALTGLQANQMLNTPKQPIQSSPMMTPMPNSNLGQLVTSMQQDQAQKMQLEAQKRAARRGMWG